MSDRLYAACENCGESVESGDPKRGWIHQRTGQFSCVEGIADVPMGALFAAPVADPEERFESRVDEAREEWESVGYDRGYEEGKSEGLEEGEDSGKRDMAREMLGCLSEDEIERLVGLGEGFADLIAALREEAEK